MYPIKCITFRAGGQEVLNALEEGMLSRVQLSVAVCSIVFMAASNGTSAGMGFLFGCSTVFVTPAGENSDLEIKTNG